MQHHRGLYSDKLVKAVGGALVLAMVAAIKGEEEARHEDEGSGVGTTEVNDVGAR